jgi:ribonucleotide reductase beta subunit family protein with ferritin-like domain
MKKWKPIRSDQIVRDRNGAPSLDDTEEIESTFMTATEIQAAIGQGQFSQAMHSASFYMGIEALARRTQVRS